MRIRMMWRLYLHTILAFSVALVNGQACDYTVTLEQLDFLEYNNVTLKCSFTSTDQNGIEWRTKATEADPYRTAYNAYPGNPHLDEPEPDFVGKLEGQQSKFSHKLTIINATESDDLNSWLCIVKVPSCSNPNDANLTTYLGPPYFSESDIIRSGNDVACYALSDPQSTVSLEDSGSGTTCVRVDGGPPTPWNCSAMREVTQKHVPVDVKCSVTYGNNNESPPTLNVIIGLHYGWITFIVLAVAGVCIGVAVVGFIYYKKKTSSSTE